MTFAAIDWGMSLEPDWYSTIYGVMLMIGQGLSTLAAMMIVVVAAGAGPAARGPGKPEAFHDLGNLMLAFTMLWAYMSFSQYLIIWSGNLTEEIPWYLRRSQGGWWYIALGSDRVPLLPAVLPAPRRDLKRHYPEPLEGRGGDPRDARHQRRWLVLPSLRSTNVFRFWASIPALVGIGGLWVTSSPGNLKSQPLVPRHNPLLAEFAPPPRGAPP